MWRLPTKNQVQNHFCSLRRAILVILIQFYLFIRWAICKRGEPYDIRKHSAKKCMCLFFVYIIIIFVSLQTISNFFSFTEIYLGFRHQIERKTEYIMCATLFYAFGKFIFSILNK